MLRNTFFRLVDFRQSFIALIITIRAAELMIRKIENIGRTYQFIVLPTELILMEF